MLFKLKFNTIAIATAVALVAAIAILPLNKLSVKQYNTAQDYTCSYKGQLIVHHYYTTNLFGYRISEGYETEKKGIAPANYQIKCLDERAGK